MQQKRGLPTALFWKYGAFGGLFVIAISLIQSILGLHESGLTGTIVILINLIVLGVVIFMGIKAHRDQVNEGFISTGRAFATGFFIAAIVGLFSAVFTFIYYQFIDPGFMQETIDRMRATLEDQEMSDEDVERTMYFTKFMMTPAASAVIALVSNIFFGLILSLIGALILNREEEETA